MHKSRLPLSLFLMMGTLIMLVPFTSINFPNVKTQEYDTGSYDYDYDDYDSYSTYPTDDKKKLEGFYLTFLNIKLNF